MNTKNVILCGTAFMIGIGLLYIWLDKKSKKEIEKPKEEKEPIEKVKPRTPEALLKGLMEKVLKENAWKNERDFLSTLSKNFLKEAPDVSWIDHLPICQEEMLKSMAELGCLEEYEIELEARYRR